MALFLPNLVWQIRHHLPILGDLQTVRREGKNVVLPPMAFVKEQILANGPALLPVWLPSVVPVGAAFAGAGPTFLSSSLRCSTPLPRRPTHGCQSGSCELMTPG